MLVQDLIKKADYKEQARLICENRPYYEKPYDKEIVEKNITQFIDTLIGLKPKKDNKEHIMIYEKYWDDEAEECTALELYVRKDLIDCIEKIKGKELPVTEDYSLDMPSEKLKELCLKFEFPQGYGYEFNAWEETLGYEVYERNLTDENIQNCIYAVLFELSFNGMTRDTQEERRKELDDSIKEMEELRALPKEEQEKHFHTIDDLYAEFNIERPTPEEQEKSYRKVWYYSLKSNLYKYKLYQTLTL